MVDAVLKIIDAFATWEMADKVAVVSAVIAFASAIYTWRSARVAREVLRLTRLEFDERHSSMTGRLIQAISWEAGPDCLMFAMACSFINNANAPNTIEKFDLVLHLLAGQNSAGRVILDAANPGVTLPMDLQSLKLPLNMNPRASESGWLCFKIPSHIAKTMSVDTYELVGTDSVGSHISLKTHIHQRIEIQ